MTGAPPRDARLDADADAAAWCFDGLDAATLADRLGLPRVVLLEAAPTTMDVAHRLAEGGAPAGTLVVAGRQTAGRGRGGKAWSSPAGGGLWLTLLERPADRLGIAVLSLRVGLAAAQALDVLVDERVGLKWPNDLQVGRGKLAGVLVEARWREQVPEHVAIGFGLNVAAPSEVPTGAGLRQGTTRLAALEAVIPALRAAAARSGALHPRERAAFASRDVAVGRRCTAPLVGIVRGVAADGALVVETADGIHLAHAGSLVLADAAPEQGR